MKCIKVEHHLFLERIQQRQGQRKGEHDRWVHDKCQVPECTKVWKDVGCTGWNGRPCRPIRLESPEKRVVRPRVSVGIRWRLARNLKRLAVAEWKFRSNHNSAPEGAKCGWIRRKREWGKGLSICCKWWTRSWSPRQCIPHAELFHHYKNEYKKLIHDIPA